MPFIDVESSYYISLLDRSTCTANPAQSIGNHKVANLTSFVSISCGTRAPARSRVKDLNLLVLDIASK